MAGFETQHAALRDIPVAPEERSRITDVLAHVARPRLCGSDGAAEVDGYLRGELDRLGYEVRELPFTFSSLPGRWALPAAGVLLIVTGVTSAALAARHHGAAALIVLLVAATLLGCAAANAEKAIRRLPWGRISGSNW